MNDALFSNHTFFSKLITDSKCSTVNTVNTILIIFVLNYMMSNVKMRTTKKKMHQLQQSCGATLALKAHGVTAEKVQLKLQDLLVCENALKRTSIEA